MRIISKFRDYYDGLQHNGGDKSQIWVRQSAPVDDEPLRLNLQAQLRRFSHYKRKGKDPQWQINPKISHMPKPYTDRMPKQVGLEFVKIPLIFCGQFYLGIAVTEKWENDAYSLAKNNVTRYYWDTASFLEDFEEREDKYSSWKMDPNNFMAETGFGALPGFKWMEACFKHKTPVIRGIVRESFHIEGVEINPNLSKLGFYTLYDPAQAYQELSMFHGGVLTNNKDPEPLADKYRIQAHGMDATSFRKGPTKVHN